MSLHWTYLTLCLLVVALRVAGQTSNVTSCVTDYAWHYGSQEEADFERMWRMSRTDIPELDDMESELCERRDRQIGNNFNPIVARQVLTGSPAPTASISVATPASSSSTSTSSSPTNTPTPTPQADAGGSSKKSNAGAIAGGVIGGLVVIALICLFILWKVMRKRRNAVQRDFSFDSSALVSGPPVQQQVTGSTGITYSSPDGPSPIPYGGQSVYAPSEHHGAYPLSPTASSAMYTSPPPGRRSLESISPSMVQLGGYQPQATQSRGYRGAAELS
ncbi:hypothetical protein CVT25_006532 [Psilocybe cyanescens]|uniref:Mid2 domain-containing protein n=1 Tax=Psilocybe cyanescens TaxID=93625 RepID=A0A409XEH2_PSICY|nr:hypothetical protein CVT25_006532 [Psilocybe cyanescens]